MTTVTRVIDGSTFETDAGIRVILDGVDAPEIDTPEAKEATDKLRSLIDGEDVATRILAVSFGRVIAEVKVGRFSVNKAMKSFLTRK